MPIGEKNKNSIQAKTYELTESNLDVGRAEITLGAWAAQAGTSILNANVNIVFDIKTKAEASVLKPNCERQHRC